MKRLGVNIDHIATIRNIRGGVEPEPALAALIAQQAGADSIVAHLREDRRHINERDVNILKDVVKVKFNLEMSIAPEIVKIACKLKPDQATLVPEKRREITTEGGLDVVKHKRRISKALSRLSKAGIEVSLFIDPEKIQIKEAADIGAGIVELHTGRYAEAKKDSAREKELLNLIFAAESAKKSGLRVCAGHGLNYFNVGPVAGIKEVEELNIGYSIVCRASIVGFEEAVKSMKRLCKGIYDA